MDLTSLLHQISSVKHFKHLSVSELKKIILSGEIRKFNKNETIFMEQGTSAGLFVLLNGQVQLCKISQQGQLSILSIIEPVIMFNEVSALDDGGNPVTAIASQASTLWQVPPTVLQQMVLNYPSLGLGLLRILAARNRKLVSQFDDLSFRTVLSRTAKLLLELSTCEKKAIVRKHHPNYQMAAQIATVPEAFSRCLQSLKKQGVINISPQVIEIIDLPTLIKIAQVEMPFEL